MKTLLIAALLVSATVVAQPVPAEKSIITVNGSASMKVVPDMSEVSIHLSALKMNMSDATRQLGEQTQHYLKILKQLGFQETDVKTTHFSASKNRVYRNSGYVDSGYIVSQDLTLKFAYNESTLQKIVARFSESKDPVDFTVGFFLSDDLRDKTEATLQADAVRDARRKAVNLSEAAGVKLGTVKAITYGDAAAQPVFYRSVANAEFKNADGNMLSFAPQEVELQESVTVMWVLE